VSFLIWLIRLEARSGGALGIHPLVCEPKMSEYIPDKKTYQANRRRMAWAALPMI